MTRKTLGCAFVFIAAAVALFVAIYIFQHAVLREQVSFVVPGTEIRIEHSRIQTHPYLAEYDRNISFYKDGKRAATTPLMIDTCGGYPINCYLINTPSAALLRLDDALSEQIIDLTNHRVYLVSQARGGAYYGELNPDDMSSGWSIMNDDPSTFQVTIGGRPAVPLIRLVGDATEQYVGKLDDRAGKLSFIPATESPEIEIHHLVEH